MASAYGQLTCDNCFTDGHKVLVHVTVEVDHGQNPSEPPYEEQRWCRTCVSKPDNG